MLNIFVNNDISPEFIEPQLSSLRKYLQEPFTYTICGGETLARKPEKAEEVAVACRAYDIPVIEIQRNETVMSHCNEFSAHTLTTPNSNIFTREGRYTNNIYASYATQWTWEEVIAKQSGHVAFMHSDVFLMEPLRPSDYLVEYDLCSTMKHRVKTDAPNVAHVPLTHLDALWETLMFLNMDKLPEPGTLSWWGGLIEDTWMPDGGGSYLYLKAHPELKILEVATGDHDDILTSDDPTVDFHPSRFQYLHVGDKKLFHYMAGCRWATDELEWSGLWNDTQDNYHQKKLAWTRRLIGV